jgi:hypothetical protein
MGRIHTFVFNGGVDSQQYAAPRTEWYQDWGVLPDKPYKVTFAFVSVIQSITPATIANIFLDLGQYTPQASVDGNPARAGYLGSIRWTITGGLNNKCLFASLEDNPPIFLQTRPHSNNFKILFYDNQYPYEESEYSLLNSQFTLCLSFEEWET